LKNAAMIEPNTDYIKGSDALYSLICLIVSLRIFMGINPDPEPNMFITV
jgi:hypothetical protein